MPTKAQRAVISRGLAKAIADINYDGDPMDILDGGLIMDPQLTWKRRIGGRMRKIEMPKWRKVTERSPLPDGAWELWLECGHGLKLHLAEGQTVYSLKCFTCTKEAKEAKKGKSS